MKNIAIRIILSLILIIVAAGPASAQQSEEDKFAGLPEFKDTSRRFETAFSYIMEGSGMNYYHIEGGEDSVRSESLQRGAVEFNLAYYFSRDKKLGIELELGYAWGNGRTQLPPVDNSVYSIVGILLGEEDITIYPTETIDHSMLSTGAHLIYNFGYMEIIPFVYFGGGVDQIIPGGDSTFPIDGQYWHVGGGIGLKYFVTEWFGGRISFDDYYHSIDEDIVTGSTNRLRMKVGAVLTF